MATDIEQAQTKPDAGVPKERLDAVLAENASVKEQNAAFKEQLDTVKAQLELVAANSRQQQAVAPPANMFEGIFAEDDEVASPKQVQAAFERAIGAVNARLSGLEVNLQFPDMAQVITKYYPEFMKRDPLTAARVNALVQVDPATAKLMAYHLAKADPAYLKAQAKQQANPEKEAAEELLQAALRGRETPSSASAASGQAGLEKAKMIASMTPEAFRAHKESVKATA
jgi:hypothetical protein